MYGWLMMDETDDGLVLTVAVPGWNPLRPAPTDPVQVRALRDPVMPFLLTHCANDPKEVSNRIFYALADIVVHIEPEHLELAMHLCAAHHRLPDPIRLAREANIRDCVDAFFGAIPQPDKTLSTTLEAVRKVAILFPDALMEMRLDSVCMVLFTEFMVGVEHREDMPDAFRPLVIHLVECVTRLKGLVANPVPPSALLQDLMLSTASAQQSQVIHMIRNLIEPGMVALLVQIEQRCKVTVGMLPALRYNAIMGMIADGLTMGPQADWSELIDAHLAAANALKVSLMNQVRWSTMIAVDAGVFLGPVCTQLSREALVTLREAMRSLDSRLTHTSAQRKRPAGEPATRRGDDLDPVHSWSVERLARWIEGPLSERKPQQRIDRQRIVSQEQARNAARPAAQPAQPTQPAAATALTTDEVGLVINDALCATARFFHDDIAELLPLAQGLGADPARLDACAALLKPLNRLAEQPTEVDELQARDLLQSAEAATEALRQSIQKAKADAQVESRFASRLGAALAAEALVLGKRHGGVIACPVAPSDWDFVVASFHRRWLPRARSITVDGQTLSLDTDQALALYVTASSLSGHAFDVSIHLWRRRPGRFSPPGTGTDLFPPMNTTDWFDTYIPCAVLHVPLAG